MKVEQLAAAAGQAMPGTEAFFDSRDTLDPAEREKSLFAQLRQQIAHAMACSEHHAAVLRGIDPSQVTGRAALAQLPVTSKSDLHELQKRSKPFGGLNATPA